LESFEVFSLHVAEDDLQSCQTFSRGVDISTDAGYSTEKFMSAHDKVIRD
jgi:hypothetical protein